VTADRPFVDRPVVDLDAAAAVARRAAIVWRLPEPTLIRRGMNALYDAGDVVLRVGRSSGPALAGHALVAAMRAHGVPTINPIDGLAADIDGYGVSGWERVEEIEAAIDWEAVGAAVRIVHTIPFDALPADYPVPAPTTFPWWDFEAIMRDVGDELDARAAAGLSAAIDRNADWRERVSANAVVCHGDVHPGNVLVASTGPLLIDWDLLCLAAPAWDHAMLTTYAERWGGDPAVYSAFSAGYGEPRIDLDLARALGELRNVAATLLRVRAGRTDPSAAAEAEHRLEYWRGDSAAQWRAQ
jgi:hypothetical protein